MKKENDILEATLSIAEHGYADAYRFLLAAYEQAPQNYGPQTLYFLACLAGGTSRPVEALGWLRKSIAENAWWYRPEVLEDDDLALLRDNTEFISLKAIRTRAMQMLIPNQKLCFLGKRKRQMIYFWLFTEIRRMDRPREKIGSRFWGKAAIGSLKPSKVLNQMDMEPIGGAMTIFLICLWQTQSKPYRTKAIGKSCAAAFLPGAICFCALC